MDSKFLIYFGLALLITAILQGLQAYGRSRIFRSLSEYLQKGEFDKFDELINKPLTGMLYDRYNVQFMKLNAAFMKGDKDQIEETLKGFNDLQMNLKQQKALYEKAFYYYVSTENQEMATKCYEKLKEIDPDENEMIETFYDTYVLKGNKYLDKTLEKVEKANDLQKQGVYTLLADMYKNAGDKENEKKYRKLLKDLNKQ